MENVPAKYRVLRVVAMLCTAIAWLILIAGLVAAIAFLLSGPGTPGLWIGGTNWTGLLLLALSLVVFVQLFVVGGSLSLAIGMERNARMNQEAIEGMSELLKAVQPESTGGRPATLELPASPAAASPVEATTRPNPS